MKNELVLDHVTRVFEDGSLALKDLCLSLPEGTKLSVLGPSGSGKTTLLRLIAGLETPDSGRIIFDGSDITFCPPHKRGFGLMFQEFALFPHLNVHDNIGFGLKMKGMPESEIETRVDQMLALTGLDGFAFRSIDELSGGERQRVALARTLAPSPRLLMLDEPLSSLDRVLRKRLLKEIAKIIADLGITTIFVTHDHEEAFAAGNMVIIMNNGKIAGKGSSPEELVESCPGRWIRDFLGM